MKRRDFLHTSGSLAALPVLLNGMPLSAITRSPLFNAFNNNSDRVLVIIQLNGGNDGLNMLVPLDQYDNLAVVRANILPPQNQLLAIEERQALHPQMTAMRGLYDEGRVGFVQNVGYPNHNRSHFRGTDIWTSGSPADEVWTTGWLGRYFDTQYAGYPEGYPNSEYPHPIAITIGSVVSETCQGLAGNYSLTLTDPFGLSPLLEGEPGVIDDSPYGRELQFLRTAISQTNAYGEVVTEAAEMGNNTVEYPENRLAQQLKNVALLIAGGLRTRIYVVNLGGFDTHANQVMEGDKTLGEHGALLLNLSEAIAAFQADLQGLGLQEKVIGMTFSEFGRRIRSNDSFGTDHGTAAPLILFGNCVRPGVLGDNPDISRDVEIQEGVPMQYDFRDVYGSILKDWFEVSENDIRTLLHPEFTYLPIVGNCNGATAGVDPLEQTMNLKVFPNPFHSEAIVSFDAPAGPVRLSLFNAAGAEVRVLTQRSLAAGPHQLPLNGQGLAGGVYFVRLQMGASVRTVRVIRQG